MTGIPTVKIKDMLLITAAMLSVAAGTWAAPSDDAALRTIRLDQEEQGPDDPPPNHFEWSGFVNAIGKSGFRTPGLSGERIGYSELETLLTYNYFFDANTAIQFGAGYGHVKINWHNNPAFHQQNFDSISVTAGSYSRVGCWTWRGNFTARFNTDAGQVPDYVLYTYALWGRYDLSSCYGAHFGFVGESGIRKDTLWPILGFDWVISPCLKIYAVYPFEANIHYDVCSPWAVEAAVVRFRYRDRLGSDEPLPRGTIEYRNGGAELRLVYDQGLFLTANVHVGCSYGGDLRVANRKDNDATHYKFRSAPYVGGEFSLKF